MAATYDVGTDAGKIRLLIGDTDTSDPIFQDDEISAFLTLEGSNVRRAAARALVTIAANQVMVLKVIRLMDLSTDGAKVAAELRAQAAELRAASEEDAVIDWAELSVDDFAVDEILNNSVLRSG